MYHLCEVQVLSQTFQDLNISSHHSIPNQTKFSPLYRDCLEQAAVLLCFISLSPILASYHIIIHIHIHFSISIFLTFFLLISCQFNFIFESSPLVTQLLLSLHRSSLSGFWCRGFPPHHYKFFPFLSLCQSKVEARKTNHSSDQQLI